MYLIGGCEFERIHERHKQDNSEHTGRHHTQRVYPILRSLRVDLSRRAQNQNGRQEGRQQRKRDRPYVEIAVAHVEGLRGLLLFDT